MKKIQRITRSMLLNNPSCLIGKRFYHGNTSIKWRIDRGVTENQLIGEGNDGEEHLQSGSLNPTDIKIKSIEELMPHLETTVMNISEDGDIKMELDI